MRRADDVGAAHQRVVCGRGRQKGGRYGMSLAWTEVPRWGVQMAWGRPTSGLSAQHSGTRGQALH